MDTQYSAVPLFPSIVHCIEINDFEKIKKEIVDFAYQEKRINPKGVNKTNKGGWQSESKYHSFDNIIKSTILNAFESSLSIFKEYLEYRFTAIWININKKGDCNILHCHPDSHLSGVLWVDTPQESGEFGCDSSCFYDRFREMECYAEHFKKQMYAYNSYYFNPTEGSMLLFPSSLNHYVTENKCRHDRISISFNLDIRH
jgi:uncharacterized protein (TIGR02466 family)